jgi:hypothetical protein
MLVLVGVVCMRRLIHLQESPHVVSCVQEFVACDSIFARFQDLRGQALGQNLPQFSGVRKVQLALLKLSCSS